MNTISRVSIFGAVFIIAGLAGIGMMVVRSQHGTHVGLAREQPIPFSHEHHVNDVGLDCRYCHTSVEESSFAGIPSTKICMNCHSQLLSDTRTLAPVLESWRTGQPIRWVRVHDLPDFAYFDHSIHLAKGIGCSSCHGRIDRMPLTWKAESMNMQWCLDCHRNPERHIRPRDQVFNIAWSRSPTDPSPESLIEEYHVRTKTDCYYCHR